MKIGIMGAMIEEVAHIKAAMNDIKTEVIGDREYHTGTIDGTEIVLVFSRWGKVASATTTATLINYFKVDKLIFTGIAGAVDEKLNIGDVVIATNLYQHDVDARPFFEKHEIPLTGTKLFQPDAELIDHLHTATLNFISEEFPKNFSSDSVSKYRIKNPQVYTGTIASGDQFIRDPAYKDSLLTHADNVLGVEMEGAAVAQVCHEHDTPYAIVRVISDNADYCAEIDFQQFVRHVAAHYSHGIIRNYLRL